MDLDTYLTREGYGAVKRLADAIDAPSVLVSQWRYGRQIPAARCPAIERETGGAVTCEEQRPDVDWNYLRTSGDFEVVR